MPLAPRSEPIGGRSRRQRSSPAAGEAESAARGEGGGEEEEEEEEEEDGAVPQVLPQEDAGSAARDLRASLCVRLLLRRGGHG